MMMYAATNNIRNNIKGAILYHYQLCPLSRFIRIILQEIGIEYKSRLEDMYDKSIELYEISKTGTIPTLLINNNIILEGVYSVIEYLEDNDIRLYKNSSDAVRAKIRSYIEVFHSNFFFEVTAYILSEKIAKYSNRNEPPDSRILRIAGKNLSFYMNYINSEIEKHYYVCTSSITIADYAIAAHISVLDFVNYIPWEKYKNLKLWYSIIKSRPSFRDILNDNIAGVQKAKHYSQLDF